MRTDVETLMKAWQDACTHTETVVSMLGEDAAMVRRRWRGSGTYRGQEFVEDHRCVTICDRSSGQWRVRYEQCSAVGG